MAERCEFFLSLSTLPSSSLRRGQPVPLLLNRGFVLIHESMYNRIVGGDDFEEVLILETLKTTFIFGGDAII